MNRCAFIMVRKTVSIPNDLIYQFIEKNLIITKVLQDHIIERRDPDVKFALCACILDADDKFFGNRGFPIKHRISLQSK